MRKERSRVRCNDAKDASSLRALVRSSSTKSASFLPKRKSPCCACFRSDNSSGGGTRPIAADVRIIAATNTDLRTAIADGSFRADLFYRLNVFPIEVPPLRQRKGDIPLLVEYFVRRYAAKARKQIRKIDKKTLKLCESYDWPGNIRELQNIIERSVILCGGDTFWIDEAW